MKRACMLACGTMFALCLSAKGGVVDSGLANILDGRPGDEPVSVLVYLSDAVDINAESEALRVQNATLQYRHQYIVDLLRAKADATQGELVNHLLDLYSQNKVQDFHAFWVANVIRVEATKDVIYALAEREDVGVIFFNYGIENQPLPIQTIEPDEDGGNGQRAPEPGVTAVRAPEVWALGIDGTGVLVATLDTGVDGRHEALASRWRGLDSRYNGHPEWAWFDPVTNTTFPQSFGSHGTHTMGSVLGGAPGREVGVAPGAQWIHAAVIDRVSISRTVSDALLSFEWLIDPDGNSGTNFDVPASCSNSWRLVTGHGYPPCDDTFWSALDACEAAGIVIIFSAGNEGPGSRTIGRPPDRATDDYRTFSVGAVNANNGNWPVASFSSRGPSNCTPNGQDTFKPEIAAPGENVTSSLPGNSYGSLSGTSMASPHVNGVVALMRQANPNISVEDIKQVIFDTAFDLGPNGDDNDYGHGMIDAYEAVTRILDSDTEMACCFSDGSCGDFLPDECRAMGGAVSFGKQCNDQGFACPQPGACCVDNATCEFTTESLCASMGGSFLGEGVSCNRACPCDAIKKWRNRCRSNGNTKSKVVYRDESHNGEVVEIMLNNDTYDVPVFGRKAVLSVCCYFGSVTAELLTPEGCFEPETLPCK